jgi:hypothetical protein
MRSIMAQLVEHNAENVQAWIDRVARRQPARATQLWLRMCEFVLPRRPQHAGTPLVNIDLRQVAGLFPHELHAYQRENPQLDPAAQELLARYIREGGAPPVVIEASGPISRRARRVSLLQRRE